MSKLFLLSLIVILACSSSNSLPPDDFKQRIEHTSDAVILDVRTQEEVATGIIAGAQVMDYQASDFDQQMHTLDKSKPYFLYCASGVRSAKARQRMIDAGFTEVITLAGGIRAWNEEGLPLEKP